MNMVVTFQRRISGRGTCSLGLLIFLVGLLSAPAMGQEDPSIFGQWVAPPDGMGGFGYPWPLAPVGAAWLTHVPERRVGDSNGGQRLMLRRNGTESLFRERWGQDWHVGTGKPV